MSEKKISQVLLPDNVTYDITLPPTDKNAMFYTTTSSGNAFSVTIPGITALTDGMIINVKFNAATASGATLNVNGLGAHAIYYREATAITTHIVKNNYVTLVYEASTGHWVMQFNFDADTKANSIGYQLRTNSSQWANKTGYTMNRYTLLFEVDGGLSGTATSITPATTKTTINFKYIPGGVIKYYTQNGNIANGSLFTAAGLWDQYPFDLQYTFNTGATLVDNKPVYVKMSINTDGTLSPVYSGSPSHPIVQALPTTEDNYVYLYLGKAYDTTHIELYALHPMYQFKGGKIVLYTGGVGGSIDESNLVHKTGNETIDGVKTFIERPLSRQIYKKIEYIQASGTTSAFPYIRTLVKRGAEYGVTESLSCILDGYFTETQTQGYCGYDGGGQLGQRNGYWSTEGGNSTVSALTRSTILQVINFNSGYDKLYKDGEQIAARSVSTALSYSAQSDYSLFVAYNGRYTYQPCTSLRLYSFKMYAGDYFNSPDTCVLIRDFIPILDIDGSPCLLDLVSNKVFTNQGLGSFVGGDEIGTISVDSQLLTNSDVSPVALTNDYNSLDNKPALGDVAYKNYTSSVTSGSSDLVTSGAVYTAIDNLPEPMVFKGTLGTNGTITDLPTASSSNEGYTYKVITAGTYASISAKVGDVFVSNGSEWVLFPAGDIDSDTWRGINVNGTALLGSAISTGAVNFKNGTNVTISGSGNNITISSTDTNYYPTRSYTTGLQISSYTGSVNCQLYVPYANGSQAGVVSGNNQTFAGTKKFKTSSSNSYGAVTPDTSSYTANKTLATTDLIVSAEFVEAGSGYSGSLIASPTPGNFYSNPLYIKFGSAPTSNSDYDAMLPASKNATIQGITSFSSQEIVYVWTDSSGGIGSVNPNVIYNGQTFSTQYQYQSGSTTITSTYKYSNPLVIELTTNGDITMQTYYGAGGSD